MNATITKTRDGLKIIVDHQDSDSLAIIHVEHRHSTFVVRTGLRGNFDVDRRPIQRGSHSLNAPLIMVPIVNHDNNQHAENENLRIRNLWDGIALYAGLLVYLGPMWGQVP